MSNPWEPCPKLVEDAEAAAKKLAQEKAKQDLEDLAHIARTNLNISRCRDCGRLKVHEHRCCHCGSDD